MKREERDTSLSSLYIDIVVHISYWMWQSLWETYKFYYQYICFSSLEHMGYMVKTKSTFRYIQKTEYNNRAKMFCLERIKITVGNFTVGKIIKSYSSFFLQVMVTPQGQQVVVTQVPRPMIHTSVSNIVQTSTVIKSNPASIVTTSTTSSLTNSNSVVSQTGVQIKQEDPKTKTLKGKSSKDMMQLFVCEWIDCTA